MLSNRDKAEVLERLAQRTDLTDDERAVLREVSDAFRRAGVGAAEAPAPNHVEPVESELRSSPRPGSRSSRRGERGTPLPPAPTFAAGEAAAILFSDGAARGNPGPAGAGAVIQTASGEVLAECSKYLGNTTNNVAEYQAVLLGLQRAIELGIRRIEVRADSELLIKQLRGEYRVRHEGLKPLYETAKRLLAQFSQVKLVHVRREHNSAADRLANLGIDNR